MGWLVPKNIAYSREIVEQLPRPNLYLLAIMYILQSDDEIVAPSVSNDVETSMQQNVTFDDSLVEETYTPLAPTDKTFFTTQDEVSDIARFLERPVQIYTYNWTEAGFSEDGFDPWTLFLSDARVKKKVDNFAFINFKLHLKFVVNCSPFLYGALRVHYRPFLHAPANIYATNGRAIAYSQRPGFFMYPQDNQAYEMDLPFFWHRDWLQLTSAADVAKMGAI